MYCTKKLCTGGVNNHVLQRFEVFFLVVKYVSFYLLGCVTRSQARNKVDFFSEFWTHTTVGIFLQEKLIICDWNLPYLEVSGVYK